MLTSKTSTLDALDKYTQTWRRFRSWNRLGGGGLVLGVASFVGAAVLDAYAHPVTGARALAFALGGVGVFSLATFFYCYFRQEYFRCPRCAKFFSRVTFWWPSAQLFRRRCVHCRLELYGSA
jgi:hypothetical protein